MSIESKEIYPNAPLRLVAFELRYPLATKLGSRETLERFQEALQDELPDVELGVEGGIAFNPQQGFQELPSRPLFKLYSRDRRTAVTLGHTSLVVETAQYSKYADFRHLLERSLNALNDSCRIGGMSRLGLRYVNEVRSSDALAPRDWRGLVDGQLLGPLFFCELRTTEYQARLQFDLGEGHSVQMNAGTGQGEFVSSSGPLKVEPESGPFFLVDIDSFSQFEVLREFGVDDAIGICDKLRDPVRHVFEHSITDKLRDEVFRVEADRPKSTTTQEVK